jgi:phosphodiesterase/alkaline phosphatase D-like protein
VRLLVVTAFLLLGGLASAGSASAAFVHSGTVSAEFGKDGTPATSFGLSDFRFAIDQTKQRLYMIDRTQEVGGEPAHIYGFEIDNSYMPVPNFPIPVPLGLDGNATRSISVDNTNLPSAGNIYYVEVKERGKGGDVLYGFNSNGEPLGGEYPQEIPEPTSACGDAVDGEGHIWIADRVTSKLMEYKPDGLPTGKTIDVAGIGEPCTFVFNTKNEDVYVAGSNPTNGNEGRLWRYSAADDYHSILEILPGTVGREPPLAFDSEHGILYIGKSAYNADGELVEQFTASPEQSREYGTAIDESTGTAYDIAGNYNYETETFALHIRVFPTSGIIPDLETQGVVGNTVYGSVDPAGGGNVTGCTFEYGTSKSYGSSVPCAPPTDYSAVTPVSAELSGLTPEVRYHYRVAAGNATGVNIGADRSFVPHYVQDLKAEPASNLTKVSATLNASYVGNGQDTHFYFEWGTTTAYGNQTASAPGDDNGSGSGAQAASSPIGGLEPGMTYHYRVIAKNDDGISISEDHTFSSLPPVTDLEAYLTLLHGNSVTLNGSWEGDGTETHYYFEWGSSTAYAHVVPAVPGGSNSASGPQHVESPISGLLPKSYYHYRLVASNPSGTTATPDAVFRTPQLSAVAYRPVLKMTETSAELTGIVNPQETGPTTYHFEYGLDSSYGLDTPESAPIGSDKEGYPAGAEITGLQPGTTYHYRLVGTSPTGEAIGPDRTFTTIPEPPEVIDTSAGNLVEGGVTLKAEVRTGHGPTVVYFQYGPTSDYSVSTIPDSPLPADDEGHPVSTSISGLQPGTTYHFRAVAVNLHATAYGADQIFTTPGFPSVTIGSASNLTQTSAAVSGIIDPELSPTTYHFEYGVTGAYEERTAEGPAIGAAVANQAVAAVLDHLQPGTTYHYRVVATNAVGSATSTGGTFTTMAREAAPSIPVKQSHKCPKAKVRKHGRCVSRRHKHRPVQHKRHRRRNGRPS